MSKGVTDRNDALDGIRGIAILLVVAVHWIDPYFPYFPGGYVGVDLFFVLSGFLITTALWKARPLPGPRAWITFQRRRVERLYPALVAFLTIGSCLVWFFQEPVSGPAAIRASALAMMQLSTFVAGSGSDSLGPFGHTWSLSVEWLFYLAWPAVIFTARHRFTPAVLASGTLTIAALMYAASSTMSAEWFYFGPLARAGQILVGASFALFMLTGRTARVPFAIGACAAAMLVVWTMAGTSETDPAYRFVGYPLSTIAAVTLLGCALRSEGLGAKLLAWTPLALLGRVSYSLYLWHVLGMQVLTPENLPLPRVGIAVVAVLGTAMMTTLSYLLLERPALMHAAQRRRVKQRELATS